jgi:AAA+ ATPase superfamily predicted ATPase
MLAGRAQELKYLNNYYRRSGSQIIVMYGASGIGKQAILREFLLDKPHYIYQARPASEREQLYQWGNELGLDGHKLPKYPDYDDIFSAILDKLRLKKVFVINDFPYIVKNSPTFVAKLVNMAHSQWNQGQVMIILTGSQIGWIENSMVGKIGEASYELTGFLKIKELSFHDLSDCFVSQTTAENIEAYAVLGGNPSLWQHFHERRTTKQNIIANILAPQAFLHRHSERIVAEELRETGIYYTILAAIAAGHHKLNDLYRHTEFSRAKISVYLKNLSELGLVEKSLYYDASRGHYRISNHFVHFYFTYLYPHLSDIRRLSGEELYETHIEPTFKSYVSNYYKLVCISKLEQWNRENRLPFTFEQCGEWVGKEGTIDIIAKDSEGKILIGQCNWEKPLMTYDDYEWLLFCAEKAKLNYDFVYLFSAGRFDEKLNLEAKVKESIRLIGASEL